MACNGNVKLQLVDNLGDFHSPDTFCRGIYGNGSSDEDSQNEKDKRHSGDIPGSAKIRGDEPLVQHTADQKPCCTACNQTEKCISKSFCGNHAGKLAVIHANSAHDAVLFYPGRNTHGNAVNNMEERNQADFFSRSNIFSDIECPPFGIRQFTCVCLLFKKGFPTIRKISRV